MGGLGRAYLRDIQEVKSTATGRDGVQASVMSMDGWTVGVICCGRDTRRGAPRGVEGHQEGGQFWTPGLGVSVRCPGGEVKVTVGYTGVV